MNLTLKELDILETLKSNYDYISKGDALTFIKSIFGSTCSVKNILNAYSVYITA